VPTPHPSQGQFVSSSGMHAHPAAGIPFIAAYIDHLAHGELLLTVDGPDKGCSVRVGAGAYLRELGCVHLFRLASNSAFPFVTVFCAAGRLLQPCPLAPSALSATAACACRGRRSTVRQESGLRARRCDIGIVRWGDVDGEVKRDEIGTRCGAMLDTRGSANALYWRYFKLRARHHNCVMPLVRK
jgi:hypothetical protein